MTAIINYKINFAKRTLELLESNFDEFKEEDKEVTFLLNCLLGLIVNVSENETKKKLAFNGKIDDEFLNFIPEKVRFIVKEKESKDFTLMELESVVKKIGNKENLKEQDKFWFINKLRNGIAHQSIEGINDDGNWVGVRLWNTYNDVRDFEIIFTIEELKNLATKLANDYIYVIDKE